MKKWTTRKEKIKMDSTYIEMIKRPLRAMKVLFILYVVLTSSIVIICAFSLYTGAPNMPLACFAVLTAGFAVLCRWAYNGLAKGQKNEWIAAMILSALCVPSLFLPLGIYSLTGLLHKSVREQCLDAEV